MGHLFSDDSDSFVIHLCDLKIDGLCLQRWLLHLPSNLQDSLKPDNGLEYFCVLDVRGNDLYIREVEHHV